MKSIKILILFLLIFTSINAIIAGLMFIIDPSGNLIGMNSDYLKFSPFKNFLIPGIVLLLINGLANLIVSILFIKNYYNSKKLIIIQGIFLIFWIIIQIFMVEDINRLHITMFAIGSLLIIFGIIYKKL